MPTATIPPTSPQQRFDRHTFDFDSDESDAVGHAHQDVHADRDVASDHDGASGHGDPRPVSAAPPSSSALDDGMLPRDVPRKTTFYDAVAERQMTQADAKLFYQRSQLDHLKTDSSAWSQAHSTPHGSPAIPPTVPLPSDPDAHAVNRLPDNGSFASLPSAAQSYSFPRIAGLRAGVARSPSVAPRTATRPSLGDHGTTQRTARESIVPGPQQNMELPSAAAVGITDDYAVDDPQINAELTAIFKQIQTVLDLRHKYIRLSLQRDGDNPKDGPGWRIYPAPPEPAWVDPQSDQMPGQPTAPNSLASSTVLPAQASAPRSGDDGGLALHGEPRRTPKKRKPGLDIGEDFDFNDLLPLPQASEFTYRLDESGVYQVFENTAADTANTPVVGVPTIKDFYQDLEQILSVSSDGPSKSFAFRRLQYLEGKFNLYALLNEYQETADTKKVPHRDFYNVRKVDTHVHHSACMNQKHLLRFIKSKMKKCPDEHVLIRDGKNLTLKEVFESINLTAYDLSIDTLDMHAHTDSFHRFDKFNLKYNPVGESRLRTIFLKTDNHIQGRYLAEITKEVIADLESSKYQMVEWRISIYGRSLDEWDNLAAWVVDNKLLSPNVRWLIQIPRLYDVYKATGLMGSFEQVVKNIFEPLFEVTKEPESHPKLHVFLQRVIGFDSVDDESKVERRLFKKYPVPNEWNSPQNPPYSYWIYYLFSNTTSLNFWRRQRGFNTFLLRPHCGEAGDSEHLAVALLCCHSISHGLLLRKVPLLQYIFYLEQIGIAMSPLSNNALFLAYERNPFHQYFRRGLNVSLSTDDPLQFAFTKEPLMEEYAVAAQIYKLSPVDMCELAKNSVKQSGFEYSVKQQWLGDKFNLPGAEGNKMIKTNVPDRREEFRHQTWEEEHRMISRYTSSHGLDGIAEHHPATESKVTSPTDTAHEGGTSSHVGNNEIGRTGLSNGRGDVSRVHGEAGAGGGSQSEHRELTDGLAELHISGHEPRYLPGMVARASRRDSMRQNSVHETDA
ncbi:AMP deaminase [Xylariaceae sp. FL1272]|nr:AMP deaminase [Xylariaceae sp. FL1272]